MTPLHPQVCAMVVIVVVYRQHSWVGLFVAFLLWKLACCFFGIMRVSPQWGAFRLALVRESLGPVSEVHDVSSNRDLISTIRGQQ